MTSILWTGRRHGRSLSKPWHTPTIHCCPRRSKNGLCSSSAVLFPRHLEIIYEINRRFLDEVRLRFPGDDGRVARLSIIDESGDKYVRMAHLASVGSHCINGVAALHSDLLTKTVLKDLYDLYPDRFMNVTNGVTPRRWMALSNPGLTGLLTRTIGDRWIKHFEDEIRKIEPFADDPAFREEWDDYKT